ncbi:MAG: hypothetical protein COA79_25910 [Planctomycetota bacterium]|nr:MAG: hypothetical protein COA79_25910 [Planctomycetota bacterium]
MSNPRTIEEYRAEYQRLENLCIERNKENRQLKDRIAEISEHITDGGDKLRKILDIRELITGDTAVTDSEIIKSNFMVATEDQREKACTLLAKQLIEDEHRLLGTAVADNEIIDDYKSWKEWQFFINDIGDELVDVMVVGNNLLTTKSDGQTSAYYVFVFRATKGLSEYIEDISIS